METTFLQFRSTKAINCAVILSKQSNHFELLSRYETDGMYLFLMFKKIENTIGDVTSCINWQASPNVRS